ncbi:EcsC family protein [Calothrix membranacea FACHB-236]|nr:EcsC family protein [Calothrix membranacea FACHB-236]
MADKLSQEIENKKINNLHDNTIKDKKSFFTSVGETFNWLAETAVGVGETVAKQTHKLIEQSTQTSGKVVDNLSQNWLIRRLSGVLNLNWLIGASENVDLAKAEAAVNKLKQQYPQESPSQISHRIMVEKATKAGGIGLATSILPGVAAALLAIDLAATTQLQSEMLYQIASAYGLNLKDPARRGEVLAIFGLALGGSRLLKAAGLGLLRNVPFAGAAIAASSNATMIYSLGYAACRFYEAKLDESTSLTDKETLATLKQESEKYLETAIAQEAVMDQILVHMILASHPEKTWSEILPELKAINLSEHSLNAIAKNIQSPQPLDNLLNQLNRDFAIPLLAQCQKIAQLNGETTEVEQNIIDAIANKFNL